MNSHSIGLLVFFVMMLIMYLNRYGEARDKKAEEHARALEAQESVKAPPAPSNCSDEDYLSEMWILGECADEIDTPWRS
jgi:hypothetical protein